MPILMKAELESLTAHIFRHAGAPEDLAQRESLLAPPRDVGRVAEGADHEDAGALLGVGEFAREDRHRDAEDRRDRAAAEERLVARVVRVRGDADAGGQEFGARRGDDERGVAALDAEWQVKAADATYRDLKVKLESQRLDNVSNAARVQAEFAQAKLQADRDEALIKLGLKSDLEYKLTKAKADELAGRTKIENQRVANFAESVEAQLAAQKVQIEKLKAA